MVQFKFFNSDDEKRAAEVFRLFTENLTDTIVVVPTKSDRAFYKNKFQIGDANILRFFTVEELTSGSVNFHMYGPKYIVIDGIDKILFSMLKVPNLHYMVTLLG